MNNKEFKTRTGFSFLDIHSAVFGHSLLPHEKVRKSLGELQTC